jgi:hypothetical protein
MRADLECASKVGRDVLGAGINASPLYTFVGSGISVACDLTLGPSPKGEGGPNGGRIAVVPLLLLGEGGRG